jgi:hypothetical protein
LKKSGNSPFAGSSYDSREGDLSKADMKLKKNTLKKHLSPFNQSAYRLLDGEGESKGSLSKTKSNIQQSKSKSKEGLKMKGTDGMKSFDSS